jgi:two-component system sensor histidine kinase UhpB
MDDNVHLPADPQFIVPMIESLDAGFTVVDTNGRFLIWNQANTRILGKGAALGLAAENWAGHYGLHCPIEQRLLRPEELPLNRAFQERRHVEQEMIVINEALPEGRWIKVIARPLYDPQQELIGAAAIIHDVTHEKASLLSNQMMSWFFRASDDGIVGLNMEGTVLLWNPGAERLFGWRSQEMVGQSVYRLVPASRRHEIEILLERARLDQDMPPADTRILHKEGHEVAISRSITSVRDSGGRVIGGVVVARDISLLKRAESELEESRRKLRLLSVRQQNLLEQQLRALARELHDEFGQQLAAMKFELAWVERHLPTVNAKLEERLESLNQLLDSTIAGLRRISKQMRPPLLEELGLCHAIEELLGEVAIRYSLQATYDCALRHLTFGLEASLAIYRIVQEALTNVVRHSGASQVAVSLTQEGERVLLRVADNGHGLPLEARPSGDNFGILGMQERARTWSGEVRVVAGDPLGTVVEGAFPVGKVVTS